MTGILKYCIIKYFRRFGRWRDHVGLLRNLMGSARECKARSHQQQYVSGWYGHGFRRVVLNVTVFPAGTVACHEAMLLPFKPWM